VAEHLQAREAEGCEGVPVGGVHVERADADHEQDGGDLDPHQDGIDAGALANADHQDDRDQGDDADRRQVDVRPRGDQPSELGVVVHDRPGDGVGQLPAEDVQDALEVAGPPVRHGGGADGVLQDQVPADDPGEQLAERGVGVGIGRARDRHHRGELGIAQRREHANEAGHGIREHQGRPRRLPRDYSRRHEDAGADHRPDAEAGELHGAQDPVQTVLSLQLFEQHPQGLFCKQRARHGFHLPSVQKAG
jgi:hypothetical protein